MKILINQNLLFQLGLFIAALGKKVREILLLKLVKNI